MATQTPSTSQSTAQQMTLERHEAKYMVHPRQVQAIREFIRPFCAPDDNAPPGEFPEYVVTTLQIDGPSLPLYRAKEEQALNRFKLRIRTYGTDGKCPIFMEIKRKIKGVIVKSRVTVPVNRYHGKMVMEVDPTLRFRSAKEESNYIQFVRATQMIMARPVVRVRYLRESYLGRNDAYSRLTFDRKLVYQPARDWGVLPKRDRWYSMDSSMAQCWPFSGLILELKTFGDAPIWMVELTERFSLVRIGFCKYYTAVRLESLFNGAIYADDSSTAGFI
jgi:SPX domain protein involved in polyphosphate accumulation